jgi:hypothetical protein
LPSKGMPSDNISFVLKKIGFGTVVYSNDSKSKNIFPDKTFKELMYAYIESGIPIIATLSSKKNNHAVIVIGRKSITEDIEIKNGLISRRSYIPFSDTFQRLLIMDDNQPPYKLVDFNKPIYDNESKSYYEIKSIIVPLYSKIHLEAYQFKSVFSDILKILNKNLKINNNTINLIPTKGKYVLRYFITSSRSYKEYISSSPNISFEYKSLIVDKAMPKFIWVGEILEGNTIKIKQTVYSILILDATESGKTGQLILASNQKHLIFDNLSGVETPKNQYLAIKFDDNQILLTFANNLKSKII